MLFFRHTSFYEDGSSADSESLHFTGEHSILTGLDFFARRDLWQAMVWLYVYRHDFLRDHSLTFFEGILHEDEEFSPRAVCEANKSRLLGLGRLSIPKKKKFDNARSKTYFTHRIDSLEQVLLSLRKFASNRPMPSRVKSTLGKRLECFSVSMQLLCIKQGDYQALSRQIHFLKQNRLYPISSREWHFEVKESIRIKLRRVIMGDPCIKNAIVC